MEYLASSLIFAPKLDRPSAHSIETMNKTLSQSFDYLRFPLIIGVIWIHSSPSLVTMNGNSYGTEGQQTYEIIAYFFSNVLARIAVPLFFLMSGYLYFRGRTFTRELYRHNTVARIKSLAIPYLIWNALWILLLFTAQSSSYTRHFFSGAHRMIRDYDFPGFLRLFWDGYDKMPIAYPFWFIRDLFTVCLLSPLIYWMVRYLRFPAILALFLLWLCSGRYDQGTIPALTAVFFFSAGAYLSYGERFKVLLAFQTRPMLISLAYPVLAILDLLTRNEVYHMYIHHLGIVFGVLMVVNLSSYWIEKGKLHISGFLPAFSFFLFAIHEPWLTFVRKIAYRLLNPQNDWMLCAIYFGNALFICLTAMLIYRAGNKFVPGIMKILTGR